MSDNFVLEAERSALRAEIASLEEQIAAFSSNKQRAAAPLPPQLKRPRQVENEHEDIEKTIRSLLGANDSALLAAHPTKVKDFEAAEQNHVQLERAMHLVQANANFTGIDLSEAEERLLSVQGTHQLRQHTLGGTLPSPSTPLGFRLNFTVREPVLVEDARAEQVDPGREYQVEGVEAEVWGGGGELQRAVDALQLAIRPNPPALFARLREYSLLAGQRHEIYETLRSSLAGRLTSATAAVGAGSDVEVAGRSALVFSNASRALSLRLDYIILLSPSGSLLPVLSLTPLISPSLRASMPASSLEVLEEIPRRFEGLLAAGYAACDSVELLVRATLGDE